MDGPTTGQVLSREGAKGRVEVDGMDVEISFHELPQAAPGQTIEVRDGRAIALYGGGMPWSSAQVTPAIDFAHHEADDAPDDSTAWSDRRWPKSRVCCEEWLG